jgi:hypothetical protein
MVHGVRLTALLDSGSTHNAGIKLLGRAGLHIAVANDDCLTCFGSCLGLRIQIDCYGLALGSFDIKKSS